MARLIIIMSLILMLVLTMSAPPARAGGDVTQTTDHGWSGDTRLAAIPAGIWNPVLSCAWIIWYQDETPHDLYDSFGGIHALNVETGEQLTIASGPGVGRADAAKGLVVWNDATGIHGRDLITADEFTIPGAFSYHPRVSENWVVWLAAGGENAASSLLAYDIADGGEPLTLFGGTQDAWVDGYAVSGNLVAWIERYGELPSSRARIVVRDLSSGATITSLDREGWVGPIDIHGTVLVYVVSDFDYWMTGDPNTIYAVDLVSGETRSFAAYINTHEGGYGIETDGRFIIYEGYPSGHDLQSGRYFDVPVNGHLVDLQDGMLVWARVYDAHAGPAEIHMAPAAEFSSGQRSRYFPETGQWLSTGFLNFWDANGGLPVFGYPGPPGGFWYDANSRYLERQRFEWHPEHDGTLYAIELGRLGDELLLSQGRDWQEFPKADPNTSHYFPETGHAIDERFWDYWSSHGLDLGDPGISYRESLALFGYPLSEPMVEMNGDGYTVLTQYFERAVFEWHPDNPEPYQVLLRRLGAEMLMLRGWLE